MVGNITFLMIFCRFWSVAINTMDKLQFLVLIHYNAHKLFLSIFENLPVLVPFWGDVENMIPEKGEGQD